MNLIYTITISFVIGFFVGRYFKELKEFSQAIAKKEKEAK